MINVIECDSLRLQVESLGIGLGYYPAVEYLYFDRDTFPFGYAEVLRLV